jgi:hypothetical protein
MKAHGYLIVAVAVILGAAQPAELLADPTTNDVWQYTLLPGSQLEDGCDICGRPTIVVPLRGTFQLRWQNANPLFSDYAWENVCFQADTGAGPSYAVKGAGTYRIGGEVAVLQNLFLNVQITPACTNGPHLFTNAPAVVERLWPMIKISLDQTNPTLLQHFRLELVAAPMREIWFSTAQGFTAGIWQTPTNHVSEGDLVSSAGRVVKRNSQLADRLGIMPPAPDLGLKDIDLLPGGEVAFAIKQDIFSESLGRTLHQGDLLSHHGRVLATNGQLIAAFAPEPPTVDAGLDAVQILDNGEVYFSVQTNFSSSALGRVIHRGDLLSNQGMVIRSNAELLARFAPADPKQDYGLRALYLWPSGEIWFATEFGFTSTNGTMYLAGDLLSDQGYVVYRNLDLLAPFAPLEDLANFGLDALFLVTDVTPPPPADRCIALLADPATGNLTLQFTGQGRVWQLLRAAALPGPWTPVTPITTDLPLTDFGALTNLPQGFYRLRAW